MSAGTVDYRPFSKRVVRSAKGRIRRDEPSSALSCHVQHDAEARLATHHPVIGFGCSFQRVISSIDCTPVALLNLRVSWESIDAPEYQPLTER